MATHEPHPAELDEPPDLAGSAGPGSEPAADVVTPDVVTPAVVPPGVEPRAVEPPAVVPPGVDALARRRLDAVFGDALPMVTSDELGLDEPVRHARPGGTDTDADLLANRPPHHDR